jgi:hypothetical protein
LLTVLLGEPELAVETWRRWKAEYTVDDADTGSTRLFPLVVRRLSALGVSDPSFARLRGFARHTWASNQHRIRAGLEAVRTLAEAGIPIVALKGLSLLLVYYGRDLSSRPMYDVDLLVPAARVADADAALQAAGWWRAAKRETAYDFRRGNLGAVDLHWHVLHQYPSRVFDRMAWQNAHPLPCVGPRLLGLAPTELLLHVCLHGVRRETRRGRAWPLDVVRIAETAGDKIDWERLVDFVDRHRMTLALWDALSYAATLTGTIPESVLDQLARAPTTELELEEYRVITSGKGLYGRGAGWSGRPIYRNGRTNLLSMQHVRQDLESVAPVGLARRPTGPRRWPKIADHPPKEQE